MPQRSNDFQRLVKTIHDAMIKVDGGTVTESALLLEPDGTRREVDILLERRIADVTVRLAVECRDRSRRSDVEWIDALIGKFQRLDVDKIVAVSSTGFTAAAASKAAEHNIEVRALKQCFAGDWRAEFSSLGFAALEILPRVKQVQAVFVPPVTEVISKATTVVCPGQVGEQTFGRLVNACLAQHVAPKLRQYVEETVLSRPATLAELDRSWEVVVPVEPDDIWLVASSGTRHRIAQLSFAVILEGATTLAKMKHFKYGDAALASTARLEFPDESYDMQVVQAVGTTALTRKRVVRDS